MLVHHCNGAGGECKSSIDDSSSSLQRRGGSLVMNDDVEILAGSSDVYIYLVARVVVIYRRAVRPIGG